MRGLKPRMSAKEAAFTCWGLAFGAASAAAGRLLAPGLAGVFAVVAALALVETVLAMARTSSRLKAIGLEGALRFRMLSRRAVFLEFFSIFGDFSLAGAGAAALTGPAELAGGLSAGLSAGFGAGLAPDGAFLAFAGFLFLVAMGFWGG